MKKQPLYSATGMILFLLAISSCSKNAMDLDLQQNNLKNRDFKPGETGLQHADYVFSGCRIRQTVNHRAERDVHTRNFEYDKDNNPVRVTGTAPGTGQPDLFFTYDKKGNLLEYYGLYYGGPTFEFLHRYSYINNRIAVDTMYIWGEYPSPTTYYSKRIRYLKYDELDRVVADSEVYVYPDYGTRVIKYNYDNNGNLVRYGASYDDKISPQRTNKVWMFVDRNYSVNNMVAANSYTPSGLPLNFTGNPYSIFMSFAYLNYYTSADIIYDCIEHGKKFPSSSVK